MGCSESMPWSRSSGKGVEARSLVFGALLPLLILLTSSWPGRTVSRGVRLLRARHDGIPAASLAAQVPRTTHAATVFRAI